MFEQRISLSRIFRLDSIWHLSHNLLRTSIDRSGLKHETGGKYPDSLCCRCLGGSVGIHQDSLVHLDPHLSHADIKPFADQQRYQQATIVLLSGCCTSQIDTCRISQMDAEGKATPQSRTWDDPAGFRNIS